MHSHAFSIVMLECRRCNSALSEAAAVIALEATDAIVERHRATIAENVKLANDFFSRHQRSFEWHPPCAGSIAFPRLLTGAPSRELPWHADSLQASRRSCSDLV